MQYRNRSLSTWDLTSCRVWPAACWHTQFKIICWTLALQRIIKRPKLPGPVFLINSRGESMIPGEGPRSNGHLQAVILDMDGVIIDSHPAHRRAWREFLATLGTNVSESDLNYILDG